MTQLTPDERWILTEASDPRGFMPNAASTAGFAMQLERRGWLGKSNRLDVWHITPEGRKLLEAAK